MQFLVVGCGSIGRRHTRNLRELGVQDILVFDPDQERGARLAAECQAEQATRLELAYAQRPEAALICAPTSLHLTLAKQALRHNCHLFVEKPLSHNLEGVQEFVREVEARGRVLLMGYNLRFDPLLHQLRAWLEESRIGHVISARLHVGSYLPSWRPWEDYRGGYGANKSLGGGVILDASHELDYALWLFGAPDSVYCAGGKHSSLQIDVEDVAEIILSYDKSVISVHLDYVSPSPQRTCDVVGDDGQIHADLIARKLMLFDKAARQWDPPHIYCPFDELYRIEMRHFLDCVAGKTSPAIDSSATVASLRLADAAKSSMTCGVPIVGSASTRWGAKLPNKGTSPDAYAQ